MLISGKFRDVHDQIINRFIARANRFNSSCLVNEPIICFFKLYLPRQTTSIERETCSPRGHQLKINHNRTSYNSMVYPLSISDIMNHIIDMIFTNPGDLHQIRHLVRCFGKVLLFFISYSNITQEILNQLYSN